VDGWDGEGRDDRTPKFQNVDTALTGLKLF